MIMHLHIVTITIPLSGETFGILQKNILINYYLIYLLLRVSVCWVATVFLPWILVQDVWLSHWSCCWSCFFVWSLQCVEWISAANFMNTKPSTRILYKCKNVIQRWYWLTMFDDTCSCVDMKDEKQASLYDPSTATNTHHPSFHPN